MAQQGGDVQPPARPAVVRAVVVQQGGAASLGVCEVDGEFVHVADNAAGRFFLFTQVSESIARPGRKTPQETGRQGLYEAIQTSYAAMFPEEHPCAGGATFGKVVQEGHPASGIACLRNLHNHAACAFPQNHRWKAIEKHLREEQGIKVQGSQ